MSVITVTSRIKTETDVSHEYDMSWFNNCVRHGCKPVVSEFTWGSRNNKDRRTLCPMDKNFECAVYGLKEKWNKFNPDLKADVIEFLDHISINSLTGETTYFFVKPDPRLKEEFWERWQITLSTLPELSRPNSINDS